MGSDRLKDWREVLERDFPDSSFTEQSRKQIRSYSLGSCVGDARLATGRFYTDSEYQEERRAIQSTPLP